MTGRYCFHRCLSVNISGGGGYLVSDFRGGGTWSQIFGGGPGLRFSGGGVPGLRFSGGGGEPGLWPHGGRYASCVHAGGLSCFWSKFP